MTQEFTTQQPTIGGNYRLRLQKPEQKGTYVIPVLVKPDKNGELIVHHDGEEICSVDKIQGGEWAAAKSN